MKFAEILSPGGWKILPEASPVAILRHCMVLVDDSNILLVGGIIDEELYSNKTLFYNFDSKLWRYGPDLKVPRRSHACGMVKKDANTNEVQRFII